MAAKDAEQILNVLPTLESIKPHTFYHRDQAARRLNEIHEGGHDLEVEEIRYLTLAWKALTQPGMQTLAHRGEVTVALLKPQLYQGKNFNYNPDSPRPLQDDKAAETLRQEITSVQQNPDGSADRGQILLDINLQFTKAQAEKFYATMRDTVSEAVWERHINFMSSGPLTFMLLRHLHREPGSSQWEKDMIDPKKKAAKKAKATWREGAAKWWRSRVGATKPEEADPATIRGTFGRSIENNIVHGSGNPDEAGREAAIIGEILGSYLPDYLHFDPEHMKEISTKPDGTSLPTETRTAIQNLLDTSTTPASD